MRFYPAMVVAHRWMGLATCFVLAIVGATGVPLLFDRGTFIEKVAGRLHETLAMGSVGASIVFVATLNAILLQVSGLYLWWRRKAMRVRWRQGWRRAIFDLHHLAGAAGLPFMLMLAVTGAIMAWPGRLLEPELGRMNAAMHTGRTFAWPVQVLYAVFTIGFVVQSVTGFLMWWRPPQSARAKGIA
jgi:uncharacterized iron-regulated membrane protein